MAQRLTLVHGLAAMALIGSLGACRDNTQAPSAQTDTIAASAPAQIPEAKDIDVCTLVPPAQLTQTFGYAFERGERRGLSGVYPAWGCAHLSEQGAHPAGDTAVTTVAVQVSTWPEPERLSDYMASMTTDGTFVMVETDQIGPVAYWNGLAMAQSGALLMNVRISGDHGLEDEALQDMAVAMTILAQSNL